MNPIFKMLRIIIFQLFSVLKGDQQNLTTNSIWRNSGSQTPTVEIKEFSKLSFLLNRGLSPSC